jgi:hypothetical protein
LPILKTSQPTNWNSEHLNPPTTTTTTTTIPTPIPASAMTSCTTATTAISTDTASPCCRRRPIQNSALQVFGDTNHELCMTEQIAE